MTRFDFFSAASAGEFSNGASALHNLNPAVKLLTTAVFIVSVVSFGRYELSRLFPYIFYPTLIGAVSGAPYAPLFKRFMAALPFCLFAGVSNIVFDKAPAFSVAGFAVTYGLISFLTVIFKTYLCVFAVFLLVCVTPLYRLTAAMRFLKTPAVFIAVFEMTVRYAGALQSEAYAKYTAYSLRAGRVKGVKINHMGALLGQLLISGLNRAERVYAAMKLRGYNPGAPSSAEFKLNRADLVFGFAVCFFCAGLRAFDIYSFLGAA